MELLTDEEICQTCRLRHGMTTCRYLPWECATIILCRFIAQAQFEKCERAEKGPSVAEVFVMEEVARVTAEVKVTVEELR